MLNCKQVSELVSQSLDRKLSLWQRLNLWMHLVMCRVCWGFRKSIVRLHRETREYADEVERDLAMTDAHLSNASRDRLKRVVGLEE